MKKRNIIYRIQILVILLGASSICNAQLSAPGRDWSDTTKYTALGFVQDSIFVFFSPPASPKKGSLKATFSTSSPVSDFNWYKFNENSRSFNTTAFATQTGVTESLQNNLDRGGYKVSVKNGPDTKDYICWLFIDEVVIDSINIVRNDCYFLDLKTITTPSALTIYNSNIFRYWDRSRTNRPEINTLGSNYFNNLTWHASNSDVILPSTSFLTLTISDPAPLYESTYDIKITNPFGRVLDTITALLSAKAAKADFTLYVDKQANNVWTDGGTAPKGEAPLALKFDTKSVNTDSVYWQILNDSKLFKNGGDSIIWKEGFKLSEGIGIIPNEKLVPGKFPAQHIAVKESSGCRDTMTIEVVVDTSGIKPDAIPNVFSPNGDGNNDYFKIKEPKNSSDPQFVTSIKSFHVSILNRRGQRVYEYSGNPKEWEGWNGKIDGNKAEAPDGVYFYIIEAVGWDDKTYKRGPYKGFVYLLRGK